jgi:PEP-CTERM motif
MPKIMERRNMLYPKPCAYILATVAIISPATTGHAANILQNPGFESGDLSPWYQDRAFNVTEDWNVTADDSYEGNFSATVAGAGELRQDIPPTLVADIVEFSLWVRHPLDSLRPVSVIFFATDGFYQQNVVNLTTDWEFIDDPMSFVPDDATVIGISISGFSDNAEGEDRTYIDDVRLIVVPEPASLGLLLVGVGAMVWRRGNLREI